MSAPTAERTWRQLYTGPVEPDGKFYTHPGTGRQYVRVSTVLDNLGKEALVRWSAGLTADHTFAQLPRIVAASRTKACGNTRNRCEHDWRMRCDACPCRNCKDCVHAELKNRHWVESQRRADEGTRVHALIKEWVLSGGIMPDHADDLTPYVTAFRTFVADYGLTPDSWEMAESTILNHTHGWGGTLDGQLRISWGRTELADDFCARLGHVGSDVVVTVDGKTREGEGAQLYVDHPLQLAPYRRGEVMLLRDGTEHPLPPTDGAAILQLRPDGYTFRPVLADDATYEAFLKLLGVWQWLEEVGEKAFQVRTFPLPEDYQRDKRNRKAREKRAAGKTTTARPTPAGDGFPINKAATTRRAPAAGRRTATAADALGVGREPAPVPGSANDDGIPF